MTPVSGSKCLKAMKGINQGGCIVCGMQNVKRVSKTKDIGKTRKVQDGREMIK
jgi:hypothetical protein